MTRRSRRADYSGTELFTVIFALLGVITMVVAVTIGPLTIGLLALVLGGFAVVAWRWRHTTGPAHSRKTPRWRPPLHSLRHRLINLVLASILAAILLALTASQPKPLDLLLLAGFMDVAIELNQWCRRRARRRSQQDS